MSEWQDIATAPKSATLLFLFDPKWGRVTGYNIFGSPWLREGELCPYDHWYLGTEWCNGDKSRGPSSVDDGSWYHENISLEPTHWMPLPEPPTNLTGGNTE